MNSEPATSTADPAQHLLSTRRHLWDEDGRAVQQPVGFRDHAEGARTSLQAPGETVRTVELAGTEVLVTAALLREFSARLRLDAGRGAISPDAEHLATLSDELAERFYTVTGLRG